LVVVSSISNSFQTDIFIVHLGEELTLQLPPLALHYHLYHLNGFTVLEKEKEETPSHLQT